MYFKNIFSQMDTFTNIFVGLTALWGFSLLFSHLFLGLVVLIYSGVIGLVTVFGFGMSYSIFQVGEQTILNDDELYSSVKMNEMTHTNKANEFIQIYVENKNEFEKNPVLKKVFDNLSNNLLLENTSNIEYAIGIMLTQYTAVTDFQIVESINK
ncbi:hypothetical protein [Celerinatantimonas yamalensis]|uniref:Uncharacterized protein n=1 Tax=Celerinatantimonas yamalensis TaxID=559956 RepID=A0ABW9G645_9GAMM